MKRAGIVAFSVYAIVSMLSCNDSAANGSSCDCIAEAIRVSVKDDKGNTVIDSIRYKYESESVVTVKTAEGSSIAMIGTRPGHYALWAYSKGVESQKMDVDVELAGPSGCRLPSTVVVDFVPVNASYQGKVASVKGSCAE